MKLPLTNSPAESFSIELFGVEVEALNTRDASAFIKNLQAGI